MVVFDFSPLFVFKPPSQKDTMLSKVVVIYASTTITFTFTIITFTTITSTIIDTVLTYLCSAGPPKSLWAAIDARSMLLSNTGSRLWNFFIVDDVT